MRSVPQKISLLYYSCGTKGIYTSYKRYLVIFFPRACRKTVWNRRYCLRNLFIRKCWSATCFKVRVLSCHTCSKRQSLPQENGKQWFSSTWITRYSQIYSIVVSITIHTQLLPHIQVSGVFLYWSSQWNCPNYARNFCKTHFIFCPKMGVI